MNQGLTALLCAVAVVAAVLAVVAGTNEALVLPEASVSVVAAALLLVGVLGRTRWPAARPIPSPPADPAHVRASFEAGINGRRDLVTLLDYLERSERGGRMASSSPDEIARLEALGPDKFRAYLGERVSDLERRT
jgi:hypothetical protein